MYRIERLYFLAILAGIVILPLTAQSRESIETMNVPYVVDGKNFVGFLAFDPAIRDPRPGI